MALDDVATWTKQALPELTDDLRMLVELETPSNDKALLDRGLDALSRWLVDRLGEPDESVRHDGGEHGDALEATYTGTKFAVVGFTEAAALELRCEGIEFTCVLPGVVNTELTSGLHDHRILRSCEPDDVARAVLQAVRRPRRTVYVPARLRAVAWSYGMLPSAARTRVMALMGGRLVDARCGGHEVLGCCIIPS